MRVKFRNLVLPLALAVFVAPAATFLPQSFFLTGRWIMLGVAAVSLITLARAFSLVKPSILLLSILYFLWCISTYSWSIVPELSLMKATALGMVLFTFILGGHDWVRNHDLSQSLNFLSVYVAVALAAALLAGDNPWDNPNVSSALYTGATENSNMLGSMVATSTSPLIWYLYRDWPKASRRILWGALLAICVVSLYLTTSRASYLVFAGIVSGFVFGRGLRKQIWLLFAAFIAAGIVVATVPGIADSLITRNIYKNLEETEDGGGEIMFSRERVWDDSTIGAQAGGWFGLGYGASFGETSFEGSFTATNYGREKGNSQLAIVEETGIVGLSLYLVLVFLIFKELIKAFFACRRVEDRTLMGLLIGTVVGMVMQSAFEAWWVAPGAPESPYFWAITGVALAVARSIPRQHVAQRVRGDGAFASIQS